MKTLNIDMAEKPPVYHEPLGSRYGWPDLKDEKKENTLKRHAKDYTGATSIHGFYYLGEDDRSIIERIFWLCCILGGMGLMFVFIRPIYQKWLDNPTIVSPDSTNYPIWNIYFPAITICSNNKVVEPQIAQLLKQPPWVNISDEFEDLKEALTGAISSTILYETQPHLLKDENLKNETKKILTEYKKYLPKAMQKVSTYMSAFVPTQSL